MPLEESSASLPPAPAPPFPLINLNDSLWGTKNQEEETDFK